MIEDLMIHLMDVYLPTVLTDASRGVVPNFGTTRFANVACRYEEETGMQVDEFGQKLFTGTAKFFTFQMGVKNGDAIGNVRQADGSQPFGSQLFRVIDIHTHLGQGEIPTYLEIFGEAKSFS